MAPKPTKKKRTPAKLTFDCVSYEHEDIQVALLNCSAKKLWSVALVNRRTEDGENGYQRAVNEGRRSKIAKYIDDGHLIPTSVLIAFEHATLSKDGKTLTVQNRRDAGWVIDGQHRLAGGEASENDTTLPVVALIGAEELEQIELFVTINREQRGVPSSLYLDLLPQLGGGSNLSQQADERARDMARDLTKDEKSPFFGKIVVTTSPGKGQLSLTNFVRKLKPHLRAPTGRLLPFAYETRLKILNNFYTSLGHMFPEEFERENSVFFRTIGFGALLDVLPSVIDITMANKKGFRVADVNDTLNHVIDFDFGSWRGRTGAGAERLAAGELRAALLSQSGFESGMTIET